MKKTIFFSCFILFFTTTSFSQSYTLADTAKANQLLEESRYLEGKRLFDSALIKTNMALLILEKTLGLNTKEVADCFYDLGRISLSKNDINRAIDFNQKSLEIRIKVSGEISEEVANTFKWIALDYYYLADYDKAIEFAEKSAFTYSKLSKKNYKDWASSLSNIGLFYYSKGFYNKSIEFGKQSLSLDFKSENPSYRSIATTYNNIGIAYNSKAEYEKAEEFHKKALNIRVNTLDSNHMDIAMSLNNLANNYKHKGEYDKAIDYAQKTLNIYMNSPDSFSLSSRIAIAYNLLGNSYRGKKDFNKAIENVEKALKIRIKVLGEKHHKAAQSYNDLGEIYFEKGDFKLADDCFQKAFLIYASNEDKADVVKNIAKVNVRNNAFGQADSLFQKSLLLFNFINSGSFAAIDDIDELIAILTVKAEFEQLWYNVTKDFTHLNQAISTYQKAISAIDYQKKSFTTEGSIAALQNSTYPIYEGAIKANLLLSEISKSNDLKKLTFDYSEVSKANLLQTQLKESDALKFANIPKDLLQKELDLRVNIALNDKQRQEKINAGKGETDSTVLAISSKLFDLHQEYDTLKQNFEKNYPDYYRLKYDFKTVDVAELQHKMLSSEQTLLSYFVGDSSVFAFVVRPDTFAVFDFKKDFALESLVKQLRDGLYGYHTASVKTEKLYEMKADSFAQAAFQLHQKLLTPLSNLLSKEVIIVPDGILGYIPFDVLLGEIPKDATRFSSHNYFGKEHIISYNYSATLWQEMQNKKHKVEPKKNFIGFAPYYNGDTTVLSKLFSDDFTMRKGLDSLKYSGEEVFKAQKLMQGEAILNKNATKEKFESAVADYRIVHLATHGKANDKIGDYCFLAFTAQKDSLGGELLYVRDIYNLTLNADLVVLSACETGIGELKRGEGIVSLARAFAYSGAKSLVTSLWSVNDKSTMHIMETFYKQIKRGKNKDYALWKAKTEYFEKAKGELAHPFFWSAFIPIGDMKALKNLP
jgi:CHAT domain-containing protein/Tfp pilus assembly protein PilF